MNRYQRYQLLNPFPKDLCDIVEKYHTPGKLYLFFSLSRFYNYLTWFLSCRSFHTNMLIDCCYSSRIFPVIQVLDNNDNYLTQILDDVNYIMSSDRMDKLETIP